MTALDEYDYDVAEVRVMRSLLNPRVWVAIPFGLAVDQSWAQYPGGRTEVQAWAVREFGDRDKTYRWERMNADTWRMVKEDR